MRQEVEIKDKDKKINISFRTNWLQKEEILINLIVNKIIRYKGFLEENDLDVEADGTINIKTGKTYINDEYREKPLSCKEKEHYGNLIRKEWLKIKWKFEKEKR